MCIQILIPIVPRCRWEHLGPPKTFPRQVVWMSGIFRPSTRSHPNTLSHHHKELRATPHRNHPVIRLKNRPWFDDLRRVN